MIPNDAMDRVCKAHETQYYSEDLRLSEHCWTDKRAGRPDSDSKIIDNESTQ
jgi:hypothetical protein